MSFLGCPGDSLPLRILVKDGFKDGQYWDISEGHHNVRLEEHSEGNILVIGGEEHRTGMKPDQYEVLTTLSYTACCVPKSIQVIKIR